MKIAIGCDHGAVDLRNALVSYLEELGHSVRNVGTFTKDSCDYPDIAKQAAMQVANGEADRGILLCSTGIGMSIAANKVEGIRCALLSDLMSARLTREHNDTNMMAMGAFIVGEKLACEIVKTWLETPFSHGERHQRRIDKVTALEK